MYRVFPTEAIALGGIVRSIVGCETSRAGYDPRLDKSQRFLLGMVEFRMLDSGSSRHELNTSSSKRFLGSDIVLVGEFTVNNVGNNLHVPMWVGTEPSIGLNEIIIHHSHDSKVTVGRVVVLGKRKMEARLEPVVVGPGRMKSRIRAVAEP